MQQPKEPWFSFLNEIFARLAVWSFRWRWLVGGICLLVLAGSAYLAQNVRTDNSFAAFFDESDPIYQTYREHQQSFGSDTESK
ncbi:MAG: hypothetical protein SV765_11580 [Pseudomonadota bacterium]|nr:hypothetical protein [Pseudomonadales bacterium]MDY6920837.1 hypothetical protein [Pseudomonadota bacterium]